MRITIAFNGAGGWAAARTPNHAMERTRDRIDLDGKHKFASRGFGSEGDRTDQKGNLPNIQAFVCYPFAPE